MSTTQASSPKSKEIFEPKEQKRVLDAQLSSILQNLDKAKTTSI